MLSGNHPCRRKTSRPPSAPTQLSTKETSTLPWRSSRLMQSCETWPTGRTRRKSSRGSTESVTASSASCLDPRPRVARTTFLELVQVELAHVDRNAAPTSAKCPSSHKTARKPGRCSGSGAEEPPTRAEQPVIRSGHGVLDAPDRDTRALAG